MRYPAVFIVPVFHNMLLDTISVFLYLLAEKGNAYHYKHLPGGAAGRMKLLPGHSHSFWLWGRHN
jgi:hypothetical protein